MNKHTQLHKKPNNIMMKYTQLHNEETQLHH